MPFVIDASIAMAWCFEDEGAPAAEVALERLRDDRADVPRMWALEVANILLVAERRGRLTEAQATHFLEIVRQLPITVDAEPIDVAGLVGVARRHQLTAYDAAYLALALRLGTDLATLAGRLAAAAHAAGVTVVA